MMGPANEAVLHFIWRERLFDSTHLKDDIGDRVKITHPGYHNSDAGPDFSQGKITIGSIEWCGPVEIHIRSSDWILHNHQTDPAYEQVILHVVWERDRTIDRPDGSRIPTIELKGLVKPTLLNQYQSILLNPYIIPCSNELGNVDEVIKVNMLERACVERLEKKSNAVRGLFIRTHQHWDQVAYRWIASNFGFKKNNDPFGHLAACVPYEIMLRESTQQKIEALLFGQGGFLTARKKDDYHSHLRETYEFLKLKYNLEPSRANATWKFLRMRPSNFPTLRIAQFAALLHQRPRLFNLIITAETLEEAKSIFSIQPSQYWDTHYTFENSTSKVASGLGKSSIELLILNAMVPLIYFYGIQTSREQFVDRALTLLSELPAENNLKTRKFMDLGWNPQSAIDSQGMIHLLDEYCKKKKCLNCQIGKNILRN